MNQQTIQKIGEHLCLFGIGGSAYHLIEIAWRGYSHWSMFVVGGICFQMIGSIHDHYREKFSTVTRCILCAGAISAVELISGLIVNRWMHMNVWDYSQLPLNINGQVCLLYSILWGILSWAADPIYQICDRLIRKYQRTLGQ